MSFSLVGSVIDLLTTILSTVGLPGLLALMVVESLGVPPLPSEVILPFAGFLVAEGTYSFAGALGAALAGGLIGAFLAYAIGRWWRHRIAGFGIGSVRLQPRHLERMEAYFARHGEATVAVARLLPIVRAYISYPAGTAKMSPVRFGTYTLIGSVPFAVVLIYAGMVLRSQWDIVANYFRFLDYAAIGLIALVVVYLVLRVRGVLAPGWPPRRPSRSPTAPPTVSSAPPEP